MRRRFKDVSCFKCSLNLHFRGTADFFALNHYTSRIVEDKPGYFGPFFNDLEVNVTVDPNWPTTESEYFFVSNQLFLYNIICYYLLRPRRRHTREILF